jgi:hypothetical protein
MPLGVESQFIRDRRAYEARGTLCPSGSPPDPLYGCWEPSAGLTIIIFIVLAFFIYKIFIESLIFGTRPVQQPVRSSTQPTKSV